MKTKLLVLFAVLLSMTIQAASPWDGTTIATAYAGGTGTSGDPYQISSPEQLAFLSQSVTGAANQFGVYFILTSDLDLNGKSWTPIGNATTTFRGTFDGKSHVISNLNVNVTTNAGLFGVAQYAKIKNVGIVGTSSVTGNSNVGGIVGYVIGAGATSFSMSGCFSNATVSIPSTGGSNVGGIVGYFNNASGVTASSSITNCYSTGNISGNTTSNGYVSGIVGRANGVAGSSFTISNSYATGTITGSLNNGITKTTTGTVVTVTNCYYINGGNITGATAKTALQMQDPAFVTTINNSQSPVVWIADWTGGNINGGYPILKPTIYAMPAATAFTTTYGTASAAQTFSVSGSYLGADIVAYAPTGFEVSSDGTSYATTATFTKSGSSASGTVYIRLKATAAAGTYDSQTIVIGSTGSQSAYINTTATGNEVLATITDAPTIGTVTAGNTQVSVEFTAPSNDGGSSIIDYTVTPYVGESAGTPVTGSGSPIVVTGLTNGTAYTFTVTARNAVGSSAASLPSSAVTPDATTNIARTINTNAKVTVIGKNVKIEAPVTIKNIQLYNFSGQLVESKNINYAAKQVSFNVQQAGIYLLIAHTAEGQLSQKIIVK